MSPTVKRRRSAGVAVVLASSLVVATCRRRPDHEAIVAGPTGIGGAGPTGTGGSGNAIEPVVRIEAPIIAADDIAPSVLIRHVRGRLGSLQACYERALTGNPGLSGKLVLSWTITSAGEVTKLETDNDNLRDAELVDCVKGLVARWRFPSPGSKPAEVAFPFVFSTAQ